MAVVQALGFPKTPRPIARHRAGFLIGLQSPECRAAFGAGGKGAGALAFSVAGVTTEPLAGCSEKHFAALVTGPLVLLFGYVLP